MKNKPLFKLVVSLLFLLLLLTACRVAASQNATPEVTPLSQTSPASLATATGLPSPQATPSQTPALPSTSPSPIVLPMTPSATSGAHPAELPNPAGYEWRLIVSGLDKPVGLANAGDGSGRLFIIEQEGLIRIIQNGVLLPDPFLDITQQVSCCGERGLLGLAFHPRYAQNGFFYVNYTDNNGDTVISRFRVSADPNRADATSEVRLLSVQQPYANHNGGAVVFGADGYLYLGLGDGGSAGDPQGNAQSLQTLLGKILRIDVDGGDPYAIPPDNPYAQGGGLPEIWAYGLRNPWRFSFDRATGDFYIGDVGQNRWEEIDYLPAHSPGGANFGWDFFEGSHPYEGSPPPGSEQWVFPAAEYGHDQGCSVTGGVVYRGGQLPAWQGVYLFGDYCSGYIWGLIPKGEEVWQLERLFESSVSITSFGEDERGEVYLVSYQGGLYQLAAQGSAFLPTVTHETGTIRFAVIGDYGSGDQNAEDVANLVKSWQPDFILTTGDNNYPSGSAATIDDNIGRFYHEYIYPYVGKYGAGAEVNRFFPTLGNHDWQSDNAQPYLDYFTLPGNERYYDFTWGVVHFFALDSDSREPDGVGQSSVQADWLRQKLAASSLPWKIVYMHHPPYSSGPREDVTWMRLDFQGWGATAVLAGHDHFYERIVLNGFPFFINGLGGGAIYNFGETTEDSQMRYNANYGAMLVEASDAQISFQFINRQGEVVDQYLISK